jgi:hypothetical protein
MSRLKVHVADFKDAASTTGIVVVVGTRLMAGAAARIAMQLTVNGLGKVASGAQKAQVQLSKWENKMEDPQLAINTRNLAESLKRRAKGWFRKPEVVCPT